MDISAPRIPVLVGARVNLIELMSKISVKIDENNPPDDWLAPKIYKGSANI